METVHLTRLYIVTRKVDTRKLVNLLSMELEDSLLASVLFGLIERFTTDLADRLDFPYPDMCKQSSPTHYQTPKPLAINYIRSLSSRYYRSYCKPRRSHCTGRYSFYF